MKNRFYISLLLALFAGLTMSRSVLADGAPVYLVEITGAISPGNADFFDTAIHRANTESAGCLIVVLDTPGGLAESMRKMVMAIYASQIPVVVYVSPAGARAASAGVMITMAADIAAMAPGTHIGAAHPVQAGGKDIGETMAEKVTNDMVAFVKGIAGRRGRNQQWAEKAVRESVSVTEAEALELKVIDLVARDLDQLIEQINGRKVGDKHAIDIDVNNRMWVKESFRTRVLKALSDPNIAYILMMIGLAGLYFELAHPGVILPGVIGSIALILAFYSFHTLPVNIAGILLIVLALIFFILEMKITSYGLLSLSGIICLLIGSVMLVDRDSGLPGISWRVIMPTLAVVGGFFVGVAGLVFRAQFRRPMTGQSGMIGEIGMVKIPLIPKGRVQIHGELWFARCKQPVNAGVLVRVIAVDGLTLDVEPLK